MSIDAEGIQFSYTGAPVLRDLCLHVPPGGRVGIAGVSGGGKSTLLRLLCGLYPVQAGVLRVHGAGDPPAIRRHVALVGQSAMLFPGSVWDNVTCGRPMSAAAVHAACEAAQLSAWLATCPDGLLQQVGERGGRVSGGEAQRIAIARAIAKDAPVVLLDEATSALDAQTGAAVLAALERLTRGRTVVSVSHQPGALMGMDRVYLLREGRLFDA